MVSLSSPNFWETEGYFQALREGGSEDDEISDFASIFGGFGTTLSLFANTARKTGPVAGQNSLDSSTLWHTERAQRVKHQIMWS